MPDHVQTDQEVGLSSEQLAGEQAQDLPDREAMSILNVGGLSGPLPVPVDPQPPVGLPDPAVPLQAPPGGPGDADFTDVGGNGGDISAIDPNDVRTLMDPRDLSVLREVADVTGAPIDAGVPVTMVPPSNDPSMPIA